VVRKKHKTGRLVAGGKAQLGRPEGEGTKYRRGGKASDRDQEIEGKGEEAGLGSQEKGGLRDTGPY